MLLRLVPELSEMMRQAAIRQAIAFLEGGLPTLQIFAGTPPQHSPDTTTGEPLLVEMPLELGFDGAASLVAAPAEGVATATGLARWGRLLNGSNHIVFDCDVGDRGSDANIRLADTHLRRGTKVAIREFRLELLSP